MRAVAALYVVLHHIYLQDYNRQHLTGLPRYLLSALNYGHEAVDLFIVLSGFCLMLPVARGDGTIRGGALRFFGRRAWRILPPYYLALALSLGLIWTLVGQPTGTHWDTSLPVSGHSILTHVVLLQDACGDTYNINHVFWSIAVEWRIYFLFPLLVWGWRRLGPLAATGLALAASYVLWRGCGHFLGADLSAHYLGLFALGMLGAGIAFSPERIGRHVDRWPWGWLAGGLALVAAGCLLASHGKTRPLSPVLTDYVVGLASSAVLVAMSLGRARWLTAGLAARPLVFVGTFAYSLYLIHAPLIQVLWQYPFAPLQPTPGRMFLALALAGMPLIVGCAYLFFLVCERPFLTSRRQPGRASLAVETALQPAP